VGKTMMELVFVAAFAVWLFVRRRNSPERVWESMPLWVRQGVYDNDIEQWRNVK